jgi:hypothetical protein
MSLPAFREGFVPLTRQMWEFNGYYLLNGGRAGWSTWPESSNRHHQPRTVAQILMGVGHMLADAKLDARLTHRSASVRGGGNLDRVPPRS